MIGWKRIVGFQIFQTALNLSERFFATVQTKDYHVRD